MSSKYTCRVYYKGCIGCITTKVALAVERRTNLNSAAANLDLAILGLAASSSSPVLFLG